MGRKKGDGKRPITGAQGLRIIHPGEGGGDVNRPLAVTIVIVCTILLWAVILIYMGYLFFGGLIPSMEGASDLESSYIAMFYWGLNLTDLLWYQLLSLVAVIGLYRLSFVGWTAGVMLSVIWVYTTTFFIIADNITGPTISQIVFWLFFAYGVFSFVLLWKSRVIFWRVG